MKMGVKIKKSFMIIMIPSRPINYIIIQHYFTQRQEAYIT